MIDPCPNCGGIRILPVKYGLPLEETVEAAERGEVILGGCVIDDDSRPYKCTNCGASFFADGSGIVDGYWSGTEREV